MFEVSAAGRLGEYYSIANACAMHCSVGGEVPPRLRAYFTRN